MFWGLILKANRKYTQTTSKSFHISQAALDSTSSQGGATQIFLTYEDQKYIICTLRKDSIEQVPLDLNFAEGDEISFQSQGSGTVTLSGYLVETDDPMSFLDGDEEEEESDLENLEEGDLRAALNKKLNKKKEKAVKAVATVEDEDDDDEDDSDFDVDAVPEVAADDSDDDEDEEEDDDDDDDDDAEEEDDDDSDEEEVQQPKAKQAKLEKPQKQQNGVAKDAEKTGKKNKQDKKKEAAAAAPQQQKAGGEKTLSGGVKIEDMRVGNGPEAKTGKRAAVYYEGRLKTNNKVFDSLNKGAGFKFGLGRGEVIKGWDIGVAGMKVGGKRRITCPPHMAYGARGSPPTIPPNSTLVFDVELKGVN